ncbi:protein translocase SEC61 complex subunit gamma [Candidatus Woesearchaeota archaeon]|nr:protein translocase SEC61 complex subunit gamma [Candidatus Woesearchaeota archaeon]MBI3035211.1 protein translocase SEC61 complex subunit gamma [Candidatus Woesearchaeota archaeon]
MELSSYWIKLKSFSGECLRILKVTKKPNRVEFKTIVKAAALGMSIIGFIGFLITMLKQVFFP